MQHSQVTQYTPTPEYQKPKNHRKRIILVSGIFIVFIISAVVLARFITGSWFGAKASVQANYNPFFSACWPDISTRPVLSIGSNDSYDSTNGYCVKALQRALNDGAGQGLAEDGTFGPLTRQAVINVQNLVGLPADGIVNAETWQLVEQLHFIAIARTGDSSQFKSPQTIYDDAHPSANPASLPAGYIDTCKLEGNNTVLYGWGYDPNAASDGEANAIVTIVGEAYKRSGVLATSDVYRQNDINNFLASRYPGSPLRGTYGFKYTIDGLQKGGIYGVTALLSDIGTGGYRAIESNITLSRPDLDGYGFPGNRIPDECLPNAPAATPPPPPAPAPTPAASTPDTPAAPTAPAAPTPDSPATPAAPAAPAVDRQPIGFIDSCERSGNGTVFYGWAYDTDGMPSVDIKITGSANVNSGPIMADKGSYRNAEINSYLASARPGSPLRDVYGFSWYAEGIYKGGLYSVGESKLLNIGEGFNASLPYNISDTPPPSGIGYGFPGSAVPLACQVDAPAPVTVTSPDPAPAAPKASKSVDPKDCDGNYKLNFGMENNPCVAKMQKLVGAKADGDYGNATSRKVGEYAIKMCYIRAKSYEGKFFLVEWWTQPSQCAISSQDRERGNPDVTTPVPNSQQLGPGGDYNPDDYKSSNELGMGGIGGSGAASPPANNNTVGSTVIGLAVSIAGPVVNTVKNTVTSTASTASTVKDSVTSTVTSTANNVKNAIVSVFIDNESSKPRYKYTPIDQQTNCTKKANNFPDFWYEKQRNACIAKQTDGKFLMVGCVDNKKLYIASKLTGDKYVTQGRVCK